MARARAFQSATALPGGTVLVAGGEAGDPGVGSGTSTYSDSTALASADLYDPRTGSWSATAAMAGPRTLHATTELADGRVLVFGGLSNGAALDAVEIYDPGLSR
jgi:N-acetylneuraminic acid mutarotase